MRTVAPLGYTIPMDGPVGDLISRTDISHFRPAHVHFLLNVPGYEPLITHLFEEGADYLDSDVVFGVKEELVVRYEQARAGPDAGRRHASTSRGSRRGTTSCSNRRAEVPGLARPAPACHPSPVTVEVTAPAGLSAAEVAERVAAGQTNATTVRTSRTVGEIVRANVLTVFNGLLAALFVLVLTTGRWQNALFGGVVVANAAIGIVQELRAKRTLDRLAVLNAPRARVVRDGAERELPVADVVLDDLLVLAAGDQVPADGVVRASRRAVGGRVAAHRRVRAGGQGGRRPGPVRARSWWPARPRRRRPPSATPPTPRGWPPRPAGSPRPSPSCVAGTNRLLRWIVGRARRRRARRCCGASSAPPTTRAGATR